MDELIPPRRCTTLSCGKTLGDYESFFTTLTKQGIRYRCPACQWAHTKGREGAEPPPPPVETKLCIRCRKQHPVGLFTVSLKAKGGRGTTCLPCREMFK